MVELLDVLVDWLRRSVNGRVLTAGLGWLTSHPLQEIHGNVGHSANLQHVGPAVDTNLALKNGLNRCNCSVYKLTFPIRLRLRVFRLQLEDLGNKK